VKSVLGSIPNPSPFVDVVAREKNSKTLAWERMLLLVNGIDVAAYYSQNKAS